MRYIISPWPALNYTDFKNVSMVRSLLLPSLFSSVLDRKKLELVKNGRLAHAGEFGAGHRHVKLLSRKLLYLKRNVIFGW